MKMTKKRPKRDCIFGNQPALSRNKNLHRFSPTFARPCMQPGFTRCLQLCYDCQNPQQTQIINLRFLDPKFAKMRPSMV